MKKILSLLLCAMIIFAAAACGSANTDAPSTTTAESTSGTNSTSGTSGTAQSTSATTVPPIIPPPDTSVFDESKITLSFGALSDVHITGNNTESNKFRNALSQLKAEAAKHDPDGLDAVAIAGDIADSGKASQVKIFSDIVKESGIENVFLTTGNHDFYGDKQASINHYLQEMGEKYFEKDVDRSMLSKGARHCVLNGAHFIFIEPTSYSNNCPYDKSVLTWLDNTLKAITEENPNAYVFLFTHPMIYDTCYGSTLSGGSWYTTHLTETLSKYPQIVTFGGHLHFPINDERTIMQTAFTSLGCGSVRYLAIERGFSNMASATVPKDAHSVSSGLLVQVDENGNVRITRMDFSNNSTFKEPWEIEAPKTDGSHLEKYTKDRKNDNQAPVLTGEPNILVDENFVTGVFSNVKITFAAGEDDDFVHHYKVTVKNKISGAVSTYRFLSDFYRHPQTSGMAKTLTFPLDITESGEYVFEVTAVDSWDAESGKISCETTLGDGGAELPSELPPVYDDFDFTGEEITTSNGKFTATLKGGAALGSKSFAFAGKTETLPALNITAGGQYALVRFNDYTSSTLTDFYNSEAGFSVEATFVNYSPSGSQGIVCGTQSPGGWGIAQSSGVPYLFTYVNGGSINISVNKKSSSSDLTHIVATFLYNAEKNITYTVIYVNGEIANSGSKSGAIAVHSSDKVGAAFCFGADIDTAGAGSHFPMTNFSLTDVKFYAQSLNYKQAEAAYNAAVSAFGS